MEQPVFDITNFNFIIMTFYLLLGFNVALIYQKLPEAHKRLIYFLGFLIFLAVVHETRDSSRVWAVVSFVEMFIGAALSVVYLKIFSKYPAPESNE